MLRVGIIGLGPDWETQYRSALFHLRDRLEVRGIYDPVRTRATPAATEFETVPSEGMLELIRRPDIRAILMLEDSWYRDAVFGFAAQCEKPLFFAGTSIWSGERISESGPAMMMPALKLRYTAATGRLRELMATRLGHALEIRLELKEPTASDQRRGSARAVELFDWCHYVVGTHPECIEWQRLDSPDSGEGLVSLHYRREHASLPTAVAKINFADIPFSNILNEDMILSAKITCQRGTAFISGDQQITWEHSGISRDETLDSERDPITVLLDLFCRRVAGGLLPVPTHDDLIIAHNNLAAAEESHSSVRPVHL